MTSRALSTLSLADDLIVALRDAATPSSLTFRDFASKVCGLRLSPVIAAIVDASEGRHVSVDDVVARLTFGCAASALPLIARRTIVVRAGGRGGKSSHLLAPKALHAAWTVPLPSLQRGEHARSLLIAPELKLAQQDLDFVKGYVDASPTLSAAVVRSTAEMVTIRRPHDGQLVDITIGAATRGAKAARGRSFVFVGMDEAAFFYADESNAATDLEIYRAAIQRVVPGGQVWIASTPFVADVGLMEKQIASNWGTHEIALVAVGGTRALNPTWDPDGTIEAAMRDEDPVNAAREIDAVPMAAGADAFFDPRAIAAAIDREQLLPLPPRVDGGAANGADFAFRSDSSALATVVSERGVYRTANLVERTPTPKSALVPSQVVADFAREIAPWQLPSFVVDGHYIESIREHAAREGIAVFSAPEGAGGKAAVYMLVRQLLHEGRIKLPNHAKFLRQLREVVSKPLAGGGLSISSPRRPGGHGDLVSAWVLAVWALAQAEAQEARGPSGRVVGQSFDERQVRGVQ
jgi:hypothetical protein